MNIDQMSVNKYGKLSTNCDKFAWDGIKLQKYGQRRVTKVVKVLDLCRLNKTTMAV